jgi:tRNA(Ile)-lysidine synthase
VIEGVRDTIRRHAMLAGGEAVLVAVSGGADSVALLWVLGELAADLRLALSVLHLDHGLRPDSAADADFVEALARARGLPVAVERLAIPAGGSLEARAALRRHAARIGADRVALGHTADDQAETVLMRVLEGAGPRGLAGIPPVRDRFIRPLIETRRADIVAALEGAGLAWREDPSNRDPKFLRNRIRHELLPLLSTTYNPRIVPALGRVAALTRDLLDQVRALAAAELARAESISGDEVVLARRHLRALPPGVAAEVLRLAAHRLGARAPLRAWAHRGLRRVLDTGPPRPFRAAGITVEVSGERVRVSRGEHRRVAPRPLAFDGLTPLPEVGLAIEARCFAPPEGWTPARGGGPGAGGGGRGPGTGARRLKSLLIDLRVPRWERDAVPLVVAGDDILWVAGRRRGVLAPVSAGTRRVLELALVPRARC